MDYRKMLKMIVAICVSIVMVFGFAACGKDDDGSLGDIVIGASESGDEPSDTDDPWEGEGGPQANEDGDSFGTIPDEAISAIGKTFSQLQDEYPDYGTEDNGMDTYMEFGGAAFPYLGAPDAKYNFVFFGTQWGPSLGDIASYFGDEMECIGVIGKVQDLFPGTEGELSFDEFFKPLGPVVCSGSGWGSSDDPLVGQLSFSYMDFDFTIRADGSETEEMIKGSFYTLMTQGDILRNEEYLVKTQEKLNAG